MALTHSGLSMEELRIVEGQGQSSEVITPSEEMNRINEMGKERLIGKAGGLNCPACKDIRQMFLLCLAVVKNGAL